MARTYTEARTATDPAAYVARMNATYAADPRGYRFEVASVDGKTATGRTRYTLRVTIAHPEA